MGNKCICWLRGSTDKQEIDSQRKELTELAINKYGFKQEDIIYIGKAGASAIKQNDLYLAEVNELLSTLENDSSIKFTFVWEISRLARVELAFYRLKDFFITHKIQLICCTPKIELFQPDGTINQGTEITLSLLVTLAKQEMEIKKERFRRGKERNNQQSRFNGGGYGALYGYEVNENGYIVPNSEESETVNLIFRLYSTGKYSVSKLTKELNDRGYQSRGGIKFTERKINYILRDTSYIGSKGKRLYPVIVDSVLFEKCADIRAKNDKLEVHTTKETRYIHFGIKHLKCRECGCNYFADNGIYKCYKHHKKICDCKDRVNIKVFDNLIWDVAQLEHIVFLLNDGKKSIEGYEEQKKVIKQKILEANNKLATLDERKFRIQDLYMAGDINKDRYDIQIAKLNADAATYKSELERNNAEIERIDNIINQIKNPTIDSYIDVVADVQEEANRKRIKAIIDQHIGKCYIQKMELFGNKATEIIINTLNEIEHKFAYCYYIHKVYKYNTSVKQWIDYYPNHDEMKQKVDEAFASMGTTVEEVTKVMSTIDMIEEELKNPDLSEGERKLLMAILDR